MLKQIQAAFLCAAVVVLPVSGCATTGSPVISQETQQEVAALNTQIEAAEASGDYALAEQLEAQRTDAIASDLKEHVSFLGKILGLIHPALGSMGNMVGDPVAYLLALAFPRVRQNALVAVKKAGSAVSDLAHGDVKKAASGIGSAVASVAAIPGFVHSSKTTSETFKAEAKGNMPPPTPTAG